MDAYPSIWTDLRLALGLSLTGIGIGLLTALVGIPPAFEPLLWVVIYLGWAVMLSRESGSPFSTGVAAGIGAGLLTGATQALLVDEWLVQNPWFAGYLGEGGPAVSLGLLAAGAGGGLLFGVLTGLVAWAVQGREGYLGSRAPQRP